MNKGKSSIAWMVYNQVTPNLLMLVLLVGGLISATRIKKEVFPEFELDIVTVRVPYPGASPEEVEQGILLAIEEAVRGIDGVKKVTSVGAEGSGTVTVELEEGTNRQKVYQDIQQGVDRIRTFPEDAEKPNISLVDRRREVLSLQIYGPVNDFVLRELAEQVRERLLQNPGITQVELSGARRFEIAVEVSQETLRQYNLTLQEVARRIEASALELPAGSIRTRAGEVLMRFSERKDWAREFAQIPIITAANGSTVHLSEMAAIRETFEESNQENQFNGLPTLELEVYRAGEETPLGVAAAVRESLPQIQADLPEGVEMAVRRDRSIIYKQRFDLLLKNGLMGLALVLLVLGLFLEFKLAFWVTMGIPTSFLGAMLFLPMTHVSINMLSMFAFIVALGIVVDDAIVAGENIYEYRQRKMGNLMAAIRGASDVSSPVAFSILTNIVAFLPLLFIPGTLGKTWGVLPIVVSIVFCVSWIEALYILPSHLAHTKSRPGSAFTRRLHHWQQSFSGWFSATVETYYGGLIRKAVHFRYLTFALCVTALVVISAYALSGRLGFILMPKVESDQAIATARLPFGSPIRDARAIRDLLQSKAQELVDAHGGSQLCEGIEAEIDENQVEITVYLTAPGIRPISTSTFSDLWRAEVGALAGLQSLRFESDRGGPGRGPAITVQLGHRNIDVLDRASTRLAEMMEDFPVVKDIDDGYSPGKPQYNFEMNEVGRSLGLTSADVARQVRHAFFGAEALRQQRARNEVRVMVRLPRTQRAGVFDLESLMVRTPQGTFVPLKEIADVQLNRAYTNIDRQSGQRTVTLSANVEPQSEVSKVLEALTDEILPQLVADHPGLSYSFEGRQAEMRDALAVMKKGALLSLLVIYILLAIPFRSYTQPFIVMFAIPFGVVGAIIGHSIMGYNLSIISLFGIIALAGVVVNDALVMIDYANRQRSEGAASFEAIIQAGVRRFRPILLTTLTTFGGLAPMIFETSRQARFMIPMALSLGFGIVFATAITLFIVPCLYMILEDLKIGTYSPDQHFVPDPAESESA
ncbi:MAG: efflux RND transporter permease subunit [Acidobacteria bacterium]|nr:efflux RND transporter permease subunit [Acidobacteriota bacterium]MCB9398665.1 efflux RND transporter permease subunit [Acidobacteriota bacterium]